MLTAHGWDKVIGFSDKMDDFPDPLGLGSGLSLALVVFAEVLCSAFVLVGFHTRLAAIPPALAMAVAAFITHAGDPLAVREKALLYLVLFASLAIYGGGSLSVDGWRSRKSGASDG